MIVLRLNVDFQHYVYAEIIESLWSIVLLWHFKYLVIDPVMTHCGPCLLWTSESKLSHLHWCSIHIIKHEEQWTMQAKIVCNKNVQIRSVCLKKHFFSEHECYCNGHFEFWVRLQIAMNCNLIIVNKLKVVLSLRGVQIIWIMD